MGKISSTLVGVAGEYYAAAELTRRGVNASITLRNTESYDIIASNPKNGKMFNIQVKTTTNKNNSWILNEKSEKNAAKNFYYILVKLNNDNKRPDFFIVPSKKVAEYIYNDHREWMSGLKRDGTPRKISTIRQFRDFENKYLERWKYFLR
jgi:hypothetical protein